MYLLYINHKNVNGSPAFNNMDLRKMEMVVLANLSFLTEMKCRRNKEKECL